MLEKADLVGAGDVIRALILWGKSVDAKFQMIGQAMQNLPTEDGIANKFIEKMKAEREQALANRAAQSQGGELPQRQQSGGGDMSFLKELLGSGDSTPNPIQEKINKVTEQLLDNALAKMTQPSTFEKYFDDELAKAKAKALAAAMIEQGAK
jgi:hypothetical protein